MKTIMILGASILQLPAIEKAKEMGLRVVAVDQNPEAVGFKVSEVEKEVISTIDTPSVLKAAEKNKIDGIMTLASDMPIQTVAVVSRKLGLVGISEEAALKATNKAFMRDAFYKAGVPTPIYFRIRGKDSFRNAFEVISQAGYQCIVKPADNSGSRGVFLLNSEADIDKAYDYSMKYSRGGELLVEEYMIGPEVSVETLAIDGQIHVVQITDKMTTGAPYFVEMGHSQPSQLDDKTKKEIADVVIAANKAVGIQQGPSHTEVIVTNSGPKIVEIGARLGGDCITTHLVPLSTGIDLIEACIKIAIGEKPEIIKKKNRGSAIRYFKQQAGVVSSIQGVELAAQVPGVKQISIVHGIGEVLTEINNSGSRMGFVIAEGANALDAIRKCEKALSIIKIEVKHNG